MYDEDDCEFEIMPGVSLCRQDSVGWEDDYDDDYDDTDKSEWIEAAYGDVYRKAYGFKELNNG